MTVREKPKMPKKGTKLYYQGFAFTVLGPGKCGERGCKLTAVKVLDPEGCEDVIHVEDCDHADEA
jgi:hypothetical protein